MAPKTVSLRPSDAVEGGAVPVDQNLTIKEARFELFNYQGKSAKETTALRLLLVNDGGAEYTQYYSAADPARFAPSADGKSLVAVADAEALSKSSNYILLASALVNAGFPENKLGDDISVLEGLYAYWIALPEPKRPGLNRPVVEGAREKILTVPSKVLRLPWEKVAKGAKTASKPTNKAEEDGLSEEVVEAALKVVAAALKTGEGETTRQKIAVAVLRDKDLGKRVEVRDAVAAAIYSPAFKAVLTEKGYVVDGESVKGEEVEAS